MLQRGCGREGVPTPESRTRSHAGAWERSSCYNKDWVKTMLNKVILIGNLGAEPELRYTQSGTAVASFSIATSERWKDAEGKTQESTEWHRIVAWGRLAEICNQYLHKGSRIYLEGKLQTRKWQDRDGSDRYITEVVAREMKMLNNRSAGENSNGGPHYEPPSTDDDVPF